LLFPLPEVEVLISSREDMRDAEESCTLQAFV
jgi:hypothetical protein